MTEIIAVYRKAAHRARLKYKVIREWKSGDTIYFEIHL